MGPTIGMHGIISPGTAALSSGSSRNRYAMASLAKPWRRQVQQRPAPRRPSKAGPSGCTNCGKTGGPAAKTPASTTTAAEMRKGVKLVWFFANWCGHCTSMHAAWDKAAKAASKLGFQMVKIECGNASNSEHEKLSDEYKIKGFPTILLLEDGVQVGEYQGQRTSEAFMSYVKEKSN